MKKLIIQAASLILLSGGAACAQTATTPKPDTTQNSVNAANQTRSAENSPASNSVRPQGSSALPPVTGTAGSPIPRASGTNSNHPDQVTETPASIRNNANAAEQPLGDDMKKRKDKKAADPNN